MKKLKSLYLWLTTLILVGVMVFPVLAATKTISNIKLSVESETYAEEEWCYVSANVSTTGCYIDDDDVSFTNVPSVGYWDEGDCPQIKIIVHAEDDYQFASGFNEDHITYSGLGEITSVSRSKSKLIIRLTLPEVDYSDEYYEEIDFSLNVKGVNWDKEDGEGYWSKNSSADSYEVKLYRDDELIMKPKGTTNRRYDFSSYFTKKGVYIFKVRALDENGTYGAWVSSGKWTVTASKASSISGNMVSSSTTGGEWLKNSVGWWWCNSDRSYPVSTWKQINGEWYYFNSSGYCIQNGWVQTNGKWYYCRSGGEMLVSSWRQINGKWYYMNESGVCVQNSWVHSNGKWYYCGANGDMLTNSRTPDGYWVDANGVWVK